MSRDIQRGDPELKGVLSEPKDVNFETREVVGIASVFGVLDMYNDNVHSRSFKQTIKERRSHFRHLWSHDFMSPPIAKITHIQEVGVDGLTDVQQKLEGVTGGLEVTRQYLKSARAEEIYEGVITGALNEMSFAFDAIKFYYEEDEETGKMVRHLEELRLWETSDVLWGANPHTVGSKSAIQFKNTGIEDESTPWKMPTLEDFTDDPWDSLSESQKDRIAAHYAYRGPDDEFGSLKLPHHLPSKSGVGKCVWHGVQASMEQILQIPQRDLRSVFEHLAQHFASWKKEPPSFRWVNLSVAVEDVLSIPNIKMDGDLLTQLKTRIRSELVKVESGTPLAQWDRRILENRIFHNAMFMEDL